MPQLDPVIWFFVLGVVAGVARADLRLPAFFGDHMVFHTDVILFRILDTAYPGSSFAGNDRFYHECLRFPLFGNPLVVTAGRAPDKQVAGFGDHFVLGLIFALGAGGGDKH